MKYSVWDNGIYRVYESDSVPMSKPGSHTALGAVPTSITRVLPPSSKYLGESERAVGEIVVESMGFKEFALLIAAGIIARWVYEKYIA